MPQISSRRMRSRGAALILCALVLLGIGGFLADIVLGLQNAKGWFSDGIQMSGPDQTDTAWAVITNPVGLTMFWLLLFGGLGFVLGLDMLVFARRNRWLVRLFLVLLLVFVVMGVFVALDVARLLPGYPFPAA